MRQKQEWIDSANHPAKKILFKVLIKDVARVDRSSITNIDHFGDVELKDIKGLMFISLIRNPLKTIETTSAVQISTHRHLLCLYHKSCATSSKEMYDFKSRFKTCGILDTWQRQKEF